MESGAWAWGTGLSKAESAKWRSGGSAETERLGAVLELAENSGMIRSSWVTQQGPTGQVLGSSGQHEGVLAVSY